MDEFGRVFVYHRQRSDSDVRPAWIIGTRAMAFIVTVAVAWPLSSTIPHLRVWLSLYAAATAVSLVLPFLERRIALTLLGPLAQAGQILFELVVISLIVLNTGAIRSPSIYLYLMTIVSAAISHRLVGTLLVASAASVSYVVVIWVAAGHGITSSGPIGWLKIVQHLSDEDFFVVFVRVCIFFLCAFSGGYLAERLSSKVAVLAHTTEALKAAKLETGDILKHLQSGILTIDLAGHIVYFNRAAEGILGVPVRKIRGLPIAEALGAQFPELAERLQTVLVSRKMDQRIELTLKRGDGRTVPIGFSTSALGGADGEPRGVISIFQDLTEAKKIEERMRAQDRLAAIGELSAAIAHEIRNPLAAISGSVEVLRDELNVTGTNRRLLDLIVKESGRLNTILTDFLTYARIRPTVCGRVSVAPVLDEVFEIARHRFDDFAGLQLQYKQGDRSLAVKADTDHFKQLMINVVFNAIEATESDPRIVRVTVGIPVHLALEQPTLVPGSPENWVAIEVWDNGSGIPPGIRERMFEPFVSSKATGTGLGLAIVSRLVEQTGGQIAVDSDPEQGTTFTIILPRFASAGPDSQRPVTLKPPAYV